MNDNLNLVESLKWLTRFYILNNKDNFFFSLNGYDIPLNIITNNKKKINLRKYRQKQLKIHSEYSDKMEEYLNKNNIDFIKEFLIIIQNRSLWEYSIDCLNNITEEDKAKYKEMNYFSLDYFLPQYSICIEVDSDYHMNRKVLDHARDIYIKMNYSIDTIRFYHFGDNDLRDNMNLNILKDKMAIANKSDSNKFDYFEIVYNDFIYDNEPTLIILSRFINFIGYERLYNNCNSNKTIIITEKDYNNLTYDINYGYNTTPIMFSSDFINLAKNLINCEVIILRHINNYSISEINYILTSNDNNALVRKLISIYNFIPYWVSEIISVPNYFKQYIGDKTSDDIFILNNLELLKTYV